MIPPRPRDEIELTTRDLRLVASPRVDVWERVEVVVAVSVHGASRDLSRCLSSIAAQRLDEGCLGVVVLMDQVSGIPPVLEIPDRLRERTWVLTGNCGSPARSRNALLEYIDGELPSCRWVARLDWDDRFAEDTSLGEAVALGDRRSATFVIGGNRVLARDGSLLRRNTATSALFDAEMLLERLRAMAEGTAANELPSCNLLLAAHSGIRYPDTSSAEDHWLVADLIFHRPGQGAVLEAPLFADYTIDGEVTQFAKSGERYNEARRALYEAASVWERVRRLPGRLLGLGQEGIVRVDAGTVCKHFYPRILRAEKVQWLSAALTSSFIVPTAEIDIDELTGAWVATYPFEETRPLDFVDRGEVKRFLLACLERRIVCGNIKRSNFRVRSSGEFLYVDIGNWIVPMDVSILRDSAARLFSIGVLGWSDEEVLRRRADHGRDEIWERLPGFSEFYGGVLSDHVRKNWAVVAKNPVKSAPRRRSDVSLLIKACAMDSEYARDQIIHIVDQFVGPSDFADRALLIDTFPGPFLRCHAGGDLEKLISIGNELVQCGVLDRVLIAPSDAASVRVINRDWFDVECDKSHSVDGVPVTPQVWGFGEIRTRYVLQCDIDSLIGRRRRDHDYLAEMMDGCTPSDVVCVAFNIPQDPDGEFRSYDAPVGEFKPEVRCGLLDLKRLEELRPLAAHVTNGYLSTTWYRSLHEVQRRRGLRTVRGGDPATFYLHPPNTRKGNLTTFGRVRDLIAQGIVPRGQWGRWDVEAPEAEWRYPPRSEPVIVLARGRNTDAARVERFVTGLAMQEDQRFGVVVMDDASDGLRPSELAESLAWLGARLTLVRNGTRFGRMLNNVIAIRDICTNPDSIIVVVDLDDTLADRTVIGQVSILRERGHDVVLGAPFRPDVPTKIYWPSFDRARETFGGDVWIHLRAFKKHLFDRLPDEALQIEGDWLPQCDDYALMIPIVEMAKKPIYVPEYLYWHERSTVFDEAGKQRRDWIIEQILSKGRVGQ